MKDLISQSMPYLAGITLAICLTVLFCKISGDYTARITTMMQQGYEEGVVPGSAAAMYQKAK